MRDLHELSLGHRIALTFVIVLVILFALALFGYLTGGWDQAPGKEAELLWSTKYESRLVELDKAAIEEAYRKHIIRLFDLWVTDYTTERPDEPPRAVKGAVNARGAFTRSMDAIEQREQRVKQREAK